MTEPRDALTPKHQVMIGVAAAAFVVSFVAGGWLLFTQEATRRSALREAETFVHAQKGWLQHRPLADILADPSPTYPSEDHPRLGQLAPDFTLLDPQGSPHRLHETLARGPVVLVFYFGAHCDHCLAQLVGLQEDANYFEALGAQILAVSPDTPEMTRHSLGESPPFPFPLLADDDDELAKQWGLIDGQIRQHGTFLLDRAGTIRWAERGLQPFLDNRTLLVELSRL